MYKKLQSKLRQLTSTLKHSCCQRVGGLCNLSMDPECRDLILQSSGISLVTSCLSSRREETVLSAITTLMNLMTPSSRPHVTDEAVVQCMLRFSLSESPRLRNLAAVFLQDCCSEEQRLQAQRQTRGQQTAVGIPLPKDWASQVTSSSLGDSLEQTVHPHVMTRHLGQWRLPWFNQHVESGQKGFARLVDLHHPIMLGKRSAKQHNNTVFLLI